MDGIFWGFKGSEANLRSSSKGVKLGRERSLIPKDGEIDVIRTR